MNTILKKTTAVLMALIMIFSIAVIPTSAEEPADSAAAVNLTGSNPFSFGYSYRYHNGYDIPSLNDILFKPFDSINKVTETLLGIKVFNSDRLEFSAEGFVDDIFTDMAECSFFDGYAFADRLPMPNKSSQLIVDLFDIDVPKTADELEVKIREHNANGEPIKAYALIFIQAYLKQITTLHVYERQVNDTTYQLVCDMTYKHGGTETYNIDLYYDTEKQIYYSSNDTGLFDLGFNFDLNSHTLYSTVNSWQKQFGFCLAYDFIANIVIMDYNTERVKFTYNDKEWMIQFWKGRYVIVPGGEVGIYNRPVDSFGSYYNCATQDLMNMSIELYHEDELLFTNGPMMHWWITGFRIGEKWYLPESLTMKGIIEFPTEEMATLFTQAASKHIRLTIEQDGALIHYTFGSYINL